MDSGDWVHFSFEGFIEGTKIGNPSDSHVLLRDNEGAADPRRSACGFENSNFDKSVKFVFEKCKLRVGNRISS